MQKSLFLHPAGTMFLLDGGNSRMFNMPYWYCWNCLELSVILESEIIVLSEILDTLLQFQLILAFVACA